METDLNQQTQFQPKKEEKMETAQRKTNEMLERGSDLYGKTKQAVSEAYEKTSRQMSGTYDQFVGYSRENPGKTTLIALGTGLGVGLLLGSVTRTSRPSRYAQPIVNALSEVAREYFR